MSTTKFYSYFMFRFLRALHGNVMNLAMISEELRKEGPLQQFPIQQQEQQQQQPPKQEQTQALPPHQTATQ
eukprot:m.111209 g.111209  ORF g.111209 m.111209 type:complete len:71 (-) comp9232_c6_seq2:486-698(-)